jgi:hypothetical protein
MSTRTRLGLVLVAVALCAGFAVADTLVLRDGRRIEGELVGVRGDSIEFRARGVFGGARLREYDRAEVRRIEIDEYSEPSHRCNDDDEPVRDRGARPRGLREREVNVAANVPWNDTGVRVREGDTLYFEGDGRVTWGKDRRDGPAGERNSPYNGGRPIPGRPGAALIGRVGEGHDYFFIGDDQGPIRVRASGRLYLGINDDFLLDNSGGFRVTVYY